MNQSLTLQPKLQKIIQNLMENDTYRQVIHQAQQLYSIRSFNLTKLTPRKVVELYQLIMFKYQNLNIQQWGSNWMENQLRIFIWFLLGYCYINQKGIKQLNQDDWIFFLQIFPKQNTQIFLFQAKSILKNQNKLVKWEEQEIQLLLNIINQNQKKKTWNQVAKELFILSDYKFFRTGKQCRERWINHHDPVKIHTPWTQLEDHTLITHIATHGKKWCLITKALGLKRTQHMVKNRFKSLYSSEQKLHPGRKQKDIIINLLNKISNNSLLKSQRKYLKKKQKKKISSELSTNTYNIEQPPFFKEGFQQLNDQLFQLSNTLTNNKNKFLLDQEAQPIYYEQQQNAYKDLWNINYQFCHFASQTKKQNSINYELLNKMNSESVSHQQSMI